VNSVKPDLIVRTEEPLNIEGRAELLMGQETPIEHFFVRSHGPVPEVDTASWRLRLEGLVRSPLTLDHADVVALAAETRRLIVECAGNGRRFFDPPARGLAFGRAALGQARWTGTRLDALLDHAGLLEGAAHVILHGLGPVLAGKPAFVRSLPITDVRERGVLLAWSMNGEPLVPVHGFPLRVVVPGWTGQHWLKWLTRVEVTSAPADGPYMREEYCLDGEMIRGPRAKALISSPADGAVLRDRVVRSSGITWAGEAEVSRVELSIDRGESWHHAQLAAYGGRGAWRRWELDLDVPAGVSGAVTVLARATDDRGRTQPERGEWNELGYLWDGWDRITVTL
jgi:sulfite oxidase